MTALIVTCAHAFKTTDGKFYTLSVHGYEFFKRYLRVFDNIKVVARTKHVADIDKDKHILMSGEGLTIYELPYYRGMRELIKRLPSLIKTTRGASFDCDCIIYRVPQVESYLTFIFGRNKRKPFAVEVVADPLGIPMLNWIMKKIAVAMLRLMTKKANGAAYVTETYLQSLYPNTAMKKGESNRYFQSTYSSIVLDEADIKEAKLYKDKNTVFELVHVSNAIENNDKGLKTFINVINELNDRGYSITGCVVGDGSAKPFFESYAHKLGVADKVRFIGRLSSKESLLERISKSDMFLFPTYSEGLPRVLIEAGACGLPILSTPVAGIPEIVEEKYLFSPEDTNGFVNMIIHLISNPLELEAMSKANIEMAKRYTNEQLQKKRDAFYSKLKRLTED